ncbi:MAG TPA: hypothetical protein ENK23_06270 [Sorangium sp.]|nr:hypothetical protein [Sorangium sp.]
MLVSGQPRKRLRAWPAKASISGSKSAPAPSPSRRSTKKAAVARQSPASIMVNASLRALRGRAV